MARISRTGTESLSVETYSVDLNGEDRAAFDAAPEDFLRSLLEKEGHTVNRLIVAGGGRTFPGEPGLVHIVDPPDWRSTWVHWPPE